MRLHKDDFEILKVIGRGAFGEVSIVHADSGTMKLLKISHFEKGKLNDKMLTINMVLCVFSYCSDYNHCI